MKFITIKELYNTIRLNAHRVKRLNPQGLIGIPRSGMMAAVMLSEEIHVGCCSVNEFIDNSGNDAVFYRHGQRFIDHNNSNIYIIVEDSCYNGSMLRYVQTLKKMFPDKVFVSLAVFLEGPCNIYKPDLCFADIRNEVLKCDPPIAFYEHNLLDNYYNYRYLWDLDGVMCVDPPCDINKEAYEKYINIPTPLHIPLTPSGRPITICTYRLNCYDKETRAFLKANDVNYDKLWMFPAQSKEIRDLTPPAQYKGDIYKRHPEYILFIESNDDEAKEICRISEKPVYCFHTGKFYKYNK